MTGLWSPEFWSGLTGPGIAILVCAAFVWALATERLVLGKQYRAIVARAEKDAETNRTLTETLIQKNASDSAATNLLVAIRGELAAAKGQG